jgi:type I restriction enzyme S subunit
MGEWVDTKLENIVVSANTGLDAIRRAPIVEEDTGVKCLRIQDISQSKSYARWGNSKVNAKDFERAQLRTGDLIMARTCSPGIVHFVKGDLNAVFNNGLARIRPDLTKTNSPFLFYLFKSPDFIGHIYGISGGTSVQLNMKLGDLLTYELRLPPLPEQKAITSVLSSLDDKIDLLHRQNKTLEALAETLFRQWFVEQAQEDWEDGVLSDEFDFTMGQSPPGSSFNEEGIGMPMFQGNADFSFRFPTQRVYTTEPTRFAKANDTLISVRAPVGAQNMADTECCIGRGVAAFRYKHNNGYYTYTYFKLRSLMREITMFNDEGTVFGSISKTDFQKIATMIPPVNLIEKFEEMASPINDKVIANCGQIKSLEKLRDTLLPKLMSGEMRVAI